MSFLKTSDPEIEKILKRANEFSQQRPLPHFDSCPRCGEIGHTSDSCPNQVPTIEKMQNDIEERISKAIQLAPDSWQCDDMGLYLPSSKSVNTSTKSWKDGEFCFNCGEFGHNCDNCNMPSYNKLLAAFGSTLEQKGNKAFLEKSHIIDNVKGICLRCEIKETETKKEEEESKNIIKKTPWS
ncbi:hypothetical protein M9Y10_019246 [Tritrichomonas musculus]|uniref:CCHC-type domain-containing protein n=1 Tax=Tritrichomonas musculus TaxID=1915356 RepID=A0ABR2HJU9_9EUKA